MERYQNSSMRKHGRYRKKQQSGWLQVLLFYVLPFLVFNGILLVCVIAKPKVHITVSDTNDYLSTNAAITIESWFPTKSIKMVMDGEELKLEKGKKRTYTATIYKNGSIEASVVNWNGMSTSVFEHVNVLDDLPPAFSHAEITDGIVTLTLSDSQSGINFDSIYAVNSDGVRIKPLTADRNKNTLTYEMIPSGLFVYAQDKAGNEVRGTFTSHKEGTVEKLEGNAENLEESGTGASDTANTEASQITID